jgi:hypothetical protein
MKRADEEYCKDTFSIFLADHVGHGAFAWTEVSRKQEPPDYYLAICGERFAVEVTTLMKEVAVSNALRMSSAGISQSLIRFCEDMEDDLRERDILRGSYVLVLQPIAELRNARPFIQERIVRYIERTRDDKAAAPEILLQQGRSRLSIRKASVRGDRLYWVVHRGQGKWEGQMRNDVTTLLREALNDKRQKLDKVNEPILLLLLDRYHLASTAMWLEAAEQVQFDGFHTVARIWQDDSTLVLHSRMLEWGVRSMPYNTGVQPTGNSVRSSLASATPSS